VVHELIELAFPPHPLPLKRNSPPKLPPEHGYSARVDPVEFFWRRWKPHVATMRQAKLQPKKVMEANGQGKMGQYITLPETSSSHLKMDDGLKTIVSFWGPAYFQGLC